ncbi:MAG: TonB-dependent receptor, partial [Cyclobacteriaceae bacterium]
FRTGESNSYGIELLLKKNRGPLTGFVAYTWSKTERTVEGANQGRAFFANYDRRHNISLVGTYTINDKWTLGSSFVYNTGRPITLPVGRYEFDNYNVNYYSDRNEYRLPDNHRLDLSATLTPRKNRNRKFKSSWVFSIYNVYNRRNPFTVYTRTKQDNDGNIIGDGSEKEARLVSLFPVLPSVTYNVKF